MYKIEFTDLENNKFNLIQNERIKKSSMSVYMYLLKLNIKQNEQYAAANLKVDTNTISISMSKFLKAYNRNHFSISIRTLKNRVDLLEDLKLIAIDKTYKCNIYSFNRYNVNEKVNRKVNNKNVLKSIGNTTVKATTAKHKSLNTKTKLKDLDSSNTSTDSVTYENFIDSQNKISNWDEIAKNLFDTFKDLKIKSNNLKAEIIRRIEKNLNNISKKFACNYIEKVVLQVKLQEQRRRTAYKNTICSNFEQQQGHYGYSSKRSWYEYKRQLNLA